MHPLIITLLFYQSFGVDHAAFASKCVGAPPQLLGLAMFCCRLDPGTRPSFCQLVEILDDATLLSSAVDSAS